VLNNGAAHLDAGVRTPASSGYDMQASSLDSAGSGPMGLRQQVRHRDTCCCSVCWEGLEDCPGAAARTVVVSPDGRGGGVQASHVVADHAATNRLYSNCFTNLQHIILGLQVTCKWLHADSAFRACSQTGHTLCPCIRQDYLAVTCVLLQASERHKSSGISLGITGPVPLPPGITDEEDKYVRRAHPLKRTLQRLFPGLFAPGLPVTARWVHGCCVHCTRQRPGFPRPNCASVLAS
jgi:hypothetical protein